MFSLSEIAVELNQAMPEISELLWNWLGERYPSDAKALALISSDGSMANSVLPELFKRVRKDLPRFSPEEVECILASLNGILLPPVSYKLLPAVVASEVCEGMIQYPSGDPLRREIESGETDREYWELFATIAPGRLTSRLKAMSPDEMIALICAVYFWWAARRLHEERSQFTGELPPPDFEEFFGSPA